MANYVIDGYPSNSEENKESITLVWFDPNINSRVDTETTMKELRLINDYVRFHIDLETCVRFLQSIEKEKILLITSGSCALELFERLGDLPTIDSIFIFCMKKKRYEYLKDTFVKIKGIYTDVELLSSAIREQIQQIERHMDVFCFFDHHHQEKSTKDLSTHAPEFLWFQLFKYVILRLPRDVQAKQQMIEVCREYYRGNSRELKLIDLFEKEYRPEQAIRWYSKESFVYKLVNKALRSEDIFQLYRFRFYIGDLSENLAVEHRKILSSNEKYLVVYRGMKLGKDEYRRLKKSKGNLISMNGFLSTSRSRSLAMTFANKTTQREDTIPLLLEIECDVERLGNSVVFADMTSISEYIEEQEILFDLSVTFLLNEITRDESIRVVRMIACNEEQMLIKDYLDETSRETEQTSAAIVFGRLMCSLGQYDKSLQYFQQLLNDFTKEDLAWIEFNIGRVWYFKGDLKQARYYYDRSYDRMMQTDPPRIKDSAHVLNSIGAIQDRRKRYDKALDYYNRVLNIQEIYFPSDHPDIARTLNNIALILYRQGQSDQALLYHNRALKIRQNAYPSGHVDLAFSLNNIGIILHDQGKYEHALRNHQQALELQEKLYPHDHIDTFHTLNCIGTVYMTQKKYHRALKYYTKALNIQQRHYPSGHVDTTEILTYIGVTYEKMNDPKSAMNYYRQALNMYEKVSPLEHINTTKIHSHIQRLSEYV